MLLATSLRPWGWLVQQALGLPGLTVSVMPAQFWQPPTPAHPRAGAKPQNETLAAWHQHYRRGMQQITAALGVVLPETLERRLLIMPEVLLASSPQFSQPMPVEGPSGPVAPLPTGFWFYDGPKWAISEPPIALRRFVERHPRPLVLSFSSLPVANRREVLAVHVEAAALLHRPLVVQTGWAGFCRQDLPRGTRAHDVLFVDFLPHDWLFARAACAIQHGGIGSIARALRHGCPLLLEPYGNDQFFNAMRVVALGVGAAMQPSTLKAAGLARVLQEQVLAPSTRHRCATLGATIRAEAGLEVAYERIDSRLVSAGGRMPRSRCGAKPPKV
jgi:UDP:flavonoid glycosyltransferase YjiC (YdhE family)